MAVSAVLRYTTVPIVPSEGGLLETDLPQQGSVRFTFNMQTTAHDLFKNIDSLIAQKLPGRVRDTPSELFYYPPVTFGSVDAALPPVHIAMGSTLSLVPELADRISSSLATESTGVPPTTELPIVLVVRKHRASKSPKALPTKRVVSSLPSSHSDENADILLTAKADQLVAENMASLRGTTTAFGDVPAHGRLHWTERLKTFPNAAALTEAMTDEEEVLGAHLRAMDKRNAELRAQKDASAVRVATLKTEIGKQKAFIATNASVIQRKEELNADVERLRIEIEVHDKRRDEFMTQLAAVASSPSPLRGENRVVGPIGTKLASESPLSTRLAVTGNQGHEQPPSQQQQQQQQQEDPKYNDALARVQAHMKFLDRAQYATDQPTSYTVSRSAADLNAGDEELDNGGEDRSRGLNASHERGSGGGIYEPAQRRAADGVFGRNQFSQGPTVANTTSHSRSYFTGQVPISAETAAAFEEVTEVEGTSWLLSPELQKQVTEVLSKPQKPLPIPRYLHAQDRYSSISPERSRYAKDPSMKPPATFASDLGGYLNRVAGADHHTSVATLLAAADMSHYANGERAEIASTGAAYNAHSHSAMTHGAQWRQQSDPDYASPPPRLTGTGLLGNQRQHQPDQHQQYQSFSSTANPRRAELFNAIDNRRAMAMASQQPFYPQPSSASYLDSLDRVYRHQQQEEASFAVASMARGQRQAEFATASPSMDRGNEAHQTTTSAASGNAVGSRPVFGRTSSRGNAPQSNSVPQFYQ